MRHHTPPSLLTRRLAFGACLLLLLLALTACGGGGGGGSGGSDSGGEDSEGSGTDSGADVIELAAVSALYASNGADWNRYVKNDGSDVLSATDTACAGTESGGYSACLHGGEYRSVPVTGVSACTGVTAADTLGAFTWSCDDSTDPVRVVSTGLQEGKHLSDLLDFSAPGWLENSVAVSVDGSAYGETPGSTWWGNTVVADNDGITAGDATADTINLVTADTNSTYTLDVNNTALVVQPGVTVTHNAADPALVTLSGDFLWVEGAFDGNANSYDGVVSAAGGNFWVLRNVSVQDPLAAFDLLDVRNSLLADVSASGCQNESLSMGWNSAQTDSADNTLDGVYVSQCSGRLLINGEDFSVSDLVYVANGQAVEVYGTRHVLRGLTLSNVEDSGVDVNATATVLVDVLATNNDGEHVWFNGANANNSVVLNATLANSAVVGLQTGNGTLSNVLANVLLLNGTANNGNLDMDGPAEGLYANIAMSHSGRDGANVAPASTSADNRFTGVLKIGNSATSNTGDDCDVSSAGGGLINVNCTDSGNAGSNTYTGEASDAHFYPGVDGTSTPVGKAAGDSANAHGGSGTLAFDSITDWTGFQNRYRTWGRDGSTFPDNTTAQTGACISGQTCRIWDWRLASGDTGDPNGGTDAGGTSAAGPVALGVLGVPDGSTAETHVWENDTAPTGQADCDATFVGSVFVAGSPNTCQSTFLLNAVEVFDDGAGNGNGLCETGETCLYTPNIGAYQGEGDLVSAGSIGTGGTVENVTLLQYQTNGAD